MCGIAGFCDLENNYMAKEEHYQKILENMRTCLSHRGNDAFGYYLKKHVGLSHARLSIRDLITGDQPIITYYQGMEYAIVYNGEIYNSDELKSTLKRAGFLFHTTSDTEVLLNAFLYYGPNFVSLLNGIFSFAIWCNTEKKLYLYRDRVGIKPLFYAIYQDTLLFASEPKALFCYPGFTPKISISSLQEILGIGPARTMGNGIFNHVKEVLPGYYYCYTRKGLDTYKYWDLYAKKHEDDYTETVLHVSDLVFDAVKSQMISDVPVCTFLSGGLDSSIVTALAYKYLQKQGKTLNTFSFDFKENDIYFQSNSFQPERDSPYVKLMLEAYPTNHTYLECDHMQLADALYDAVDAKDFPGMADVDASLLYFCSLVKKQNKVALTGECADEIFGGYPWFYRKDLLNIDGFPWAYDLTARTLFLKEEWIHTLDLKNYSYDHYKASLSSMPTLDGESKEEQKRRQISYLNIKWFMQTLLDRMDRTSMYSGLEARVPFADHRIIEYVYNVPWKMKYKNGVEKSLLRDAVENLLPESVRNRKKSPYPKTYHPAYEALITERFLQILDNKNAPIHLLIDKEKALNFARSPKEYGRPWFGQLMAGPQLIAYFIQMNYWMEKYHLSI